MCTIDLREYIWTSTQLEKSYRTSRIVQLNVQSPHSDHVTRCYFNLCLQQGSREDRVSRDVFSFLYV